MAIQASPVKSSKTSEMSLSPVRLRVRRPEPCSRRQCHRFESGDTPETGDTKNPCQIGFVTMSPLHTHTYRRDSYREIYKTRGDTGDTSDGASKDAPQARHDPIQSDNGNALADINPCAEKIGCRDG